MEERGNRLVVDGKSGPDKIDKAAALKGQD